MRCPLGAQLRRFLAHDLNHSFALLRNILSVLMKNVSPGLGGVVEVSGTLEVLAGTLLSNSLVRGAPRVQSRAHFPAGFEWRRDQKKHLDHGYLCLVTSPHGGPLATLFEADVAWHK